MAALCGGPSWGSSKNVGIQSQSALSEAEGQNSNGEDETDSEKHLNVTPGHDILAA